MTRHDLGDVMTERIEFAMAPNGESNSAAWFRDPQDFTERRLGKQHRSQATHASVETIVRKRQSFGRALTKSNVLQSSLASFPFRRFNHFHHCIGARDQSCRANRLRYRE